MPESHSFPDDENGQVLQSLADRGIDLTSLRIVDFEHCFPDETAATGFRDAVLGTVLEARLIPPDPATYGGWEVQCRERMIPTHEAITQTEQRLATVATQFDGYADGWGTLSKPDGSPAD